MSNQERHIYEFGSFRLDTGEQLLFHNNRSVPLAPKVFETLVVLVKHNGHLVDKNQLMSEIWPDTFVEEVNLSVNISALRKALRDGENGVRYIETVPKRGYRFVAPIRDGEMPESLLVSPTRRAKSQTWSGLAKAKWVLAGILFVVLTGLALHKFVNRPVKSDASFQSMKIVRLTNSGKLVTATISPDGQHVAYAEADEGKQGLWLRQVGTASNVQILPATDVSYSGLLFSKDSKFLYYVVDEFTGVLYRIPVLGGTPKKLIVDIDSLVAFSPDGQRLAFLRGYPAAGESDLFVSDIDGANQTKLAVRKNPDFFSVIMDAPTWSPDGKIIACPGGRQGNGESYMTVLGVDVSNGQVQPLTSQHWSRVRGMTWLPDDKGLVLIAKEDPSSPSQLWNVSYPDGSVQRITNDLNNYSNLSLTANGAAMVVVEQDNQSNMWLASGQDGAAARTIKSDNLDGVDGLAWTPDGRIVYASRTTGKSDIWIMDHDGANRKRLTEVGNNTWPSVSADGRFVVFASDRSGARNIWRMDIDGGNQKALTNGGSDMFPDCCSDDSSVIYLNGNGRRLLFRVPIEGGTPAQLTSKASSRPSISPDGKLLACAYFDSPGEPKTAVYSVAGGEPIKLLNFKDFNLRWTSDGRALSYADPNSGNLVSEPIDGGPPKQLTRFDRQSTFRFAWSRDGKELALVRGQVRSDAVLITGFR